MSTTNSIAVALPEMAKRAPYQPAVIFPAGRDAQGRAKSIQFSYHQLNEATDRYAHGLAAQGIRQGDRVLLLLRPGVELIATVFALLKVGAVPVLIDPGMGVRPFLQCVTEAEPVALIGIPSAHLLRLISPKPFSSVRHTVVADQQGWPRWACSLLAETTLSAIGARDHAEDRSGGAPYPLATSGPDDEAVIAFTSGSTGVPKGVIFHHGLFHAQLSLLKAQIGIAAGEVDLALLYVFALFNPALGVTTIIPDMDPTKSAEVNPAYVVEAILTHGVTNAFGSPTIWKRVAPYCQETGIRLPSLRRVLMAGAPVPPDLIEAMHEHVLLGDADVYTPFGATEAMPLTTISGRTIVAETAAMTKVGRGMCIGKPLPGITIRVIETTDEAIVSWDDNLVVPSGEIGEITVKGPIVTRSYLNRPEKTALAKIREGNEIWHRMGDLGYFDDQGRLWFCGRKSHRVTTSEGTMYPVLCETIFNQHPDVVRTALVGLGPREDQKPVLIVEAGQGPHQRRALDQQRLTAELLALGAAHEHTRSIAQVVFYPGVFPTDVRHNAKIQREKLARWAAQRHRCRVTPERDATVPLSDEGISYPGSASNRLRTGHLVCLFGFSTAVLAVLAGVAVSVHALVKRMQRHSRA